MNHHTGGFVQLIIIIVLLLVIISLLGVSIQSVINNKTLQENFFLAWRGIVWLWDGIGTEYAIIAWEFIYKEALVPIGSYIRDRFLQ